MKLFLDDIRIPGMAHNAVKGLGLDYLSTDKWTIARDYFEFVNIVNKHFDEIELVSFDHDTDNTSGRQNIIGAINGYLKAIEGKDITDFRYYHNGIVNGKFV